MRSRIRFARSLLLFCCAAAALSVGPLLGAAADAELEADLKSSLRRGDPSIASMSVLAFGPGSVLFVGDSKGGAIFAVQLDEQAAEEAKPISVGNIEAQIAALLGADADDVLIHDLAVSPVSFEVYLAVSRGRAAWDSRWELPNDVADATVLLRVDRAGAIHEVALDDVLFARAALPNPVANDKKHTWKEGISLRADTITDIGLAGRTLFVAGLSNEEFASTLWRLPVPFRDGAAATSVEIFHGAHGEWETHAPIRTFVPYEMQGKTHLLAAYLCTPLVTFDVSDLTDGKHIKGRTIGEFGAGNYPLDMVVLRRQDKEEMVIANSNLPLMLVDKKDIEAFEGDIDSAVDGYTAGVPFQQRSGTGIQQLDNMDDRFLVTLTRQPGGQLDLESMQVRR